MVFKTGANAQLGLPDFQPTVVDDTPRVPVGTIAKAYDDAQGEGEFIYLPGAASNAVGTLVVYDLLPGGQTTARTLAATHLNSGRPVAVSLGVVGVTQYGWFQISGVAVVNVLAAFAAGQKVFLTATPGSLDDAAVAGCQVLGAISSSAIATPVAGKAYVTINRPCVQGQIT